MLELRLDRTGETRQLLQWMLVYREAHFLNHYFDRVLGYILLLWLLQATSPQFSRGRDWNESNLLNPTYSSFCCL
jgi:hypothetical protein